MIKTIRLIIKTGLIVFFIGLLAFIVLLISLISKTITYKEPILVPDAIIVLGAQVKADGSLSVQLTDRLEAAYKAHQTYPKAIIITCGGQGPDEPIAEALAMKNWMVNKGVLESSIFTDTTSVNTRLNLKNALTILQSVNPSFNHVYIVTSDYHLPRALALSEDLGLTAQGIPAPTLPSYWIKNYIRETLAWGKYYTQKYFNWPKSGI